MSKRKKRRPQSVSQGKTEGPRPRRGGRPGPQGHSPSWLKTILLTAAGLLSGAIVILPLTSRAGMLNAIGRIDYLRLTDQLGRGAWLMGGETGPGWAAFRTKLRQILRKHEKARRHDALASLMTTLIAKPDDSRDRSAVQADADRLLQIDRENLVARLAAAVLRDRLARRGAAAAPTDLDRFASLRDIVEQPPPYKIATLHGKAYTRLWQTALQPQVRRPDVRLALSRNMPAQFVPGYDDTYEGLLTVDTTLQELAGALRKAGHAAEAAACERWADQMALGIIENETDTAARLLCVRFLLEGLEPDSVAARRLGDLIREIDLRRQSAPHDLTDQSMQSTFGEPALDPGPYERALASLVIVLVFSGVALGAALLLIFAGVGALLARVSRRAVQVQEADRTLPFYVTIPAALLPAIVTAVLVLRAIGRDGLYSFAWVFVAICSVVTVGALGIAALAAWQARPTDKKRIRRKVLAALPVLAPLVMLAIPPAVTAGFCQRLDLWVGAPVFVLSGLFLLILVALWVSPARLGAIGRMAAMGWCVNMAAALAILPFHRAADRRHQQAVLSIGGDEFKARLGEDWQAKYLQPAREALRIGQP